MALETIALFRTLDTLSAWPYWKPPTARWKDKREMTEQNSGHKPKNIIINHQASVIPLLGGG